MLADEVRWWVVEFPQEVADGELPRSRWFIADEGVIVAEVIRYGEHDAFEIAKRLNQWEEQERERLAEDLRSVQRANPVGADGPTGG